MLSTKHIFSKLAPTIHYRSLQHFRNISYTSQLNNVDIETDFKNMDIHFDTALNFIKDKLAITRCGLDDDKRDKAAYQMAAYLVKENKLPAFKEELMKHISLINNDNNEKNNQTQFSLR